MSTTTHDRSTAADLSREEAWVLHTALLVHIGQTLDRDRSPRYARKLLSELETDETKFTQTGFRFLSKVLSNYRDEAPARDRAVVDALVAEFEAAT